MDNIRNRTLERNKKSHNLRVIKGGCDAAIDQTERRFLSAFVTDTRLMGVLGVSIHWELESPDFITDFYQFFYYDAEEYGLESYKSALGGNPSTIAAIEEAMLGGLGGSHSDLEEKEARFLIQQFAEKNRMLKAPLPENRKEFQFLLKEPVELTKEEWNRLARKICAPILSDEQLIHYYLMRCFGLDDQGASYLTAENGDFQKIGESIAATLCKNTVDPFVDAEGKASYLCESLIEINDRYKMIISELTTEKGKITSAHRQSAFSITPAEASMQLSRPEYITVYEIMTEPEEFDLLFLPKMLPCMQTVYESGRLFMEFNRDNSHVNRRVFQLNEDIHGLYYVTDFGQLIIAAYELPAIRQIERSLMKGDLHTIILPAAKFEFKEPILYEFIQSGYDDFNDFLDSLQ